MARISTLPAFLLFATVVTSTQAASLLLRQAQTCGGVQGLQQCGGSLPSDFCCPKDSTCMNLNSADVQSVICCPAGQDCAFIQPITCDVTQLNATLYPDNQMHLSSTTGVELPTCGAKCCPLGYTCSSGMCKKDETAPTPTSSATPSPSASSPSASSPSATKPASEAGSSQTSGCPTPVSVEQGFDGKSFAAGLFPGLVIGALGAIALMWLINKRRSTQAEKKYSGDFGHVARQISDPIYDPEHAARVDFIRRPSHSTHRSPNSYRSNTAMVSNGMPSKPTIGTGLTPRIRSMWDRTPKLNFGFPTSAPGLPSNPNPKVARPPPAVRAGSSDRDPYKTPTVTPARAASQRRTSRSSRSRRRDPEMSERGRAQRDNPRPAPEREHSTETIDVLMPAPHLSFLAPPKAPGMRENRDTCDSGTTTFTKLMERAGFDDDIERGVKNLSSPAKRF
ncbi:uncharacterized protein M421DRAFT_419311 [Didymella exigua CBS 183.55]|uniref:Mid2 domain-containing protein n=1 Tax=Didymella exigua CBS 183.55 TaxID=1150837 RepID=A0A6A5RP25_9PLEO|nr:uncharacterized protein M421DRAFT_419311 [Didymella exigua CBS 183.55]KAF1929522.1 hypothetical protein M421DRAFT_419311 [Didymella exigua CBS 183.55]